MRRRRPWTLPLPFTASLLLGCHADDSERFRAYTTQTTLAGDGPSCDPDVIATDIDPRRSLFETSLDALEPFSVWEVFDALAENGGLAPPWHGFSAMLDEFRVPCDGYQHPWGPEFFGADIHTTGLPGINGYPVLCQRHEWYDGLRPLAVVNRFDLAPADGSHCGEVRLIFGTHDQNPMSWHPDDRISVIIEAQIPNPSPECGIQACRPLEEFWASLSEIDDATARADELSLAFLDGHPELEAAGFGPFMDWRHITFGTGQIRINGYHGLPRMLRQLEAVAEPLPWGGSTLSAVPVPVDGTSFAGLWSDPTLEHGALCQDAIVASVDRLMVDDPNRMALDLPPECLAGESLSLSWQDRPSTRLADDQSPGSLYQRIQDEILAQDPTSELTPVHIARRAELVSCVGCHEGMVGPHADLGPGAPGIDTRTHFRTPASYVPIELLGPLVPGELYSGQHVSFNLIDTCAESEPCYFISPALEDVFLPFREQVLEDFLDSTACCTDENGACCDAELEPPACDPAVQLCGPIDECDPTSESCGAAPPDGCDPSSENCGSAPDPTGESCFDPTGEGNCVDPTQEMQVGPPQGFAATPEPAAPRPFEALDVEAFMALERQLRLRQAPTTIGGRPNVGGH